MCKLWNVKEVNFVNRIAFTLAEVLVTLGIIGVVAAMTMPVLIQHHRKTEIATSVKKFYTNMSQAILLSEIDNGFSADWLYEGVAWDGKGGVTHDTQRARALTFFNKYLANYLKYTELDDNPKEIQNEDGKAAMIKVYLADGTYFLLNSGNCAHFIYDANGSKKPNISGRDEFQFLLCPTAYRSEFLGENKSNFGPYCGAASNCATRNDAKTQCINSPKFCSGLLMFDGWEFKSDYPHKL